MMNSCQQCGTLILKYKHYKKKYEREKQSNDVLMKQVQQQDEKIKELEFLCHQINNNVDEDLSSGRLDRKKSKTLMPRHHKGRGSNEKESVLAPEFNWLGSEVEDLVIRNEELENKLKEFADRNNDLKNCLMIAQGRKIDLQTTLLANMRVYEKSLEDSVLEGENSAHIDLMQQLFSVQENIEKILLSEVAYLRQVLSAQQHVIASASNSPEICRHQSPNHQTSPTAFESRSQSERVGFNLESNRTDTIRAEPARETASLDLDSPTTRNRLLEEIIAEQQVRERHHRGVTGSIRVGRSPIRQSNDKISVPSRRNKLNTRRSRSISSSSQRGSSTSHTLSHTELKEACYIPPKSPGMKTRRWATAALQAEVDKILKDISGIIV